MSCDTCHQQVNVSINWNGDTDNVEHYCKECFLEKYGSDCRFHQRKEYNGHPTSLPRWIYGPPNKSYTCKE